MSAPAQASPPKLLTQVRRTLRLKHYSPRTESAYVRWLVRFIRFNQMRHPRDMGEPEVTAFLSSLAQQGQVSAATQTQAFSAILFLYREVLHLELPWLTQVVRAPARPRLPVVLTRAEVKLVVRRLRGVERLCVMLLYGSGLRLLECLKLRVKDIDIDKEQIVVRAGKGDKDRITVLPTTLKAELSRHLEQVRQQHQRDIAVGGGKVDLPGALDRKYPNAGREWKWQWVFPATRVWVEKETRERRRHHLHESVIQRAVIRVVRRTDGIVTAVGRTVHAAVKADGKPCRLPERVRTLLGAPRTMNSE